MKYNKIKVIKWLTWLSCKSKPVFLIEEMQPSWLTKEQEKFYLIVTLLNGMLLGLLFGTPYGFIIHFYLSYSWGLSLGALVNGIFLGIAAGLIVGTGAQYFLKIHEDSIKTHGEVILSWKSARYNLWKSFKKSVYEAIGIGILVFFFCLLIVPILKLFALKNYTLKILLMMGLIVGFFFGIVTLIARLLSNSLVKKRGLKTLKANQGILDARKNAFLIARITTVVLAIINTLILLFIHTITCEDKSENLLITLMLGLFGAVVTGGVVAFIHRSGRSCQQHLALRIVLYMTGDIPWDYAKFLDYASKIGFLNKIGGSYQFFHQEFKTYLASFPLDVRDRLFKSASSPCPSPTCFGLNNRCNCHDRYQETSKAM